MRKIFSLFLTFLSASYLLAQQSTDLRRHDFFYAGESVRQQMFKVEGGKVTWHFSDPQGRGEISDAVLLSDGHILMAHQHGIKEIAPRPSASSISNEDNYTVLWQMEAPRGYEIHSIQPIGQDKVIYVQCGNPMQAVVMEIPSLKEIKRIDLPFRDGGSHGQMRNFRLTRRGTLLLAHMQFGLIMEFDDSGRELNRWPMPGAWGVEELANGNILACSNQGFVREFNNNGAIVWEFNWRQQPGSNDVSPQKAHRLPNGNTLINNWFNEWGGKPVNRQNPPVQAIEVTPDGKVVWELRSWNDPADLGPSTTIQLLSEPVNRMQMHFGNIHHESQELSFVSRRDIMKQVLEGKTFENYVPAVFFMHFPARVGRDAIYYHVRHLNRTGCDLLKIQFEQHQPNIKIETVSDWQKIQPLPRDFYAPTLEVVKEVFDIVGEEAMVLPTVYSAFQTLRMQIGIPAVIKWAKESPDEMLRALRIYNEALLNFVRDCKALGIDGFFMPTQGGENIYNEVPNFFERFVSPFDMELMKECTTGTHCNILHICDWEGPYDSLDRFLNYPGEIVNTPNVVAGKAYTSQDAAKQFNRIILGGLERKGVINKGTPEEVTAEVEKLLQSRPEHYILGAECTIDNKTNIENIRAAIRVAHGKKLSSGRNIR